MRHLVEEGTKKEERRRGVSGSFSVWLFLSYGCFSFIILLL